EVLGVDVGVRRHLHRDALVHRAVRVPVELGLADLEQRDVALRDLAQDLSRAVVGVDPVRDPHRGRGHPGPQRLDDGVAPGDDLGRAVAAPLLPPLAALAALRALPLGGLLALVRDVVGPVLGLRRRALALETLAALAAGADGRALLAAGLAHGSAST